MNIQLCTRLIHNEAIVFTKLDDTIVMMDMEKGHYYELDPLGTRIWLLLERGLSVAEVCDTMMEKYEITPEICHEDTLTFLNELNRMKIVQALPDEGHASPHPSTHHP